MLDSFDSTNPDNYTVGDGEVQWMTAGKGILHEETLPSSERLLGVQLWLNLPTAKKWYRRNTAA